MKTYWIIKDEKGNIIPSTLRTLRIAAIYACESPFQIVNTDTARRRWKHSYKVGYRCVRCTVSEQQGATQ